VRVQLNTLLTLVNSSKSDKYRVCCLLTAHTVKYSADDSDTTATTVAIRAVNRIEVLCESGAANLSTIWTWSIVLLYCIAAAAVLV
jgi:hypothetical protein